MRDSLTFFLFFTFFSTLIADVSEDVYVTGSVIKKTSLLVANPITKFDLDDIEKRGTLYIVNFLRHLPQINPSNSNFPASNEIQNFGKSQTNPKTSRILQNFPVFSNRNQKQNMFS